MVSQTPTPAIVPKRGGAKTILSEVNAPFDSVILESVKRGEELLKNAV